MRGLDLLAVDRRLDGCDELARTLAACGHRIHRPGYLAECVEAAVLALRPDVVVVSAESPDDDILDELRAVSLHAPLPIAMFVDDSEPEQIEQALAAGVSSYVVRGVSGDRPERIASVIAVAVVRFRAWQALRAELEESRASLEERKLVERAKGLLMLRQGLSEHDAYRKLQRAAMNRAERMADVARCVLAAGDVL